jgi:hypothetical protein
VKRKDDQKDKDTKNKLHSISNGLFCLTSWRLILLVKTLQLQVFVNHILRRRAKRKSNYRRGSMSLKALRLPNHAGEIVRFNPHSE